MALESFRSWTDDIPICKHSGIGSATNEIYRKDGRRAEMHPVQDRHFHFRYSIFFSKKIKNAALLFVVDL